MSRGFVKEDDQEEIPMVPPRADLPEGLKNYVTQTGMDQLLAEKEALLSEIKALDSTNEKDKRIAHNLINSKLDLLNERIVSATIIDLSAQPQEEVRFGASITLKIGSNSKTQQFQIVGVDEADIAKGKISFVSPIAKALVNKKVGDTAVLKRPSGDLRYEILGISYED
ncbi:GreA/GreB family elongation factor [Subsaximicrobium wynnwilliamsii]|jgi:transcription elongation factor GreB|uniref:GreA/GreB family elongation factor n=1 Tax=Subsaximicrobium wynnwilliamsii TaxID=291179 RepID=A0A5C6ZPV9_9FLAO|nr:GreA/GreB family elongation factor [Subsaximicrobium wynnwilliamsii]TXD85361.1 GreA/GreB family elongation factor [Subsaximicrobium wynnwilliamsii]TXD90713.1 GreA/GreB family elongation factor [Subsaximicrobium wynnwilliamsii]TXE05221.1 GreA/GreB family elongation factor [Subsaximicrobium wynnwilliamsii]